MAEPWKKYWRWIIGIGLVYLYPFYCLLIGMIPGVNWPPLLTFGLELKDFMTVWIALGGIVAVVVGIFQTQNRITKQEKQFKEQTDLQQKQQRDARFASGVELLGNPHESTRIGGAYNLYFLARDFEEYRAPVCEILCAHIRTVTGSKDYQANHTEEPSNEIQTTIDLLFLKRGNDVSIFSELGKNLAKAYLNGINFLGYRLNNVTFFLAKLNKAHCDAAQLSSIDFMGAELDGAGFRSSVLDRCSFYSCRLINTNFTYARLNVVNFRSTILIDTDFKGTCLQDIAYEEIKEESRSLELTGADKAVLEYPTFNPYRESINPKMSY